MQEGFERFVRSLSEQGIAAPPACCGRFLTWPPLLAPCDNRHYPDSKTTYSRPPRHPFWPSPARRSSQQIRLVNPTSLSARDPIPDQWRRSTIAVVARRDGMGLAANGTRQKAAWRPRSPRTTRVRGHRFQIDRCQSAFRPHTSPAIRGLLKDGESLCDRQFAMRRRGCFRPNTPSDCRRRDDLLRSP